MNIILDYYTIADNIDSYFGNSDKESKIPSTIVVTYPSTVMKPFPKKSRGGVLLRHEHLRTRYLRAEVCSIWEQSSLNYEAANYSTSLLVTADSPSQSKYAEKTSIPPEKVRDHGFRKAIVKLYDHRCALCGIKILTSENHTIVDAAHIIPWSVSCDDRPTNRMALCKLCHWSFDEGLMAVNSKYQVMISQAVKKDPNLPGHILTLSDRPIFRPSKKIYWPVQENFQWHRKERFKKSG